MTSADVTEAAPAQRLAAGIAALPHTDLGEDIAIATLLRFLFEDLRARYFTGAPQTAADIYLYDLADAVAERAGHAV